MTRGVFRLRSAATNQATGFRISRHLVLTAAHCVSPDGEVKLSNGRDELTGRAVTMASSAALDAALVILEQSDGIDASTVVPIRRIREGSSVADLRWQAPGYATGDSERLGLTLTGALADVQGEGDLKRLQLSCDQFGADSGGIAGSSGSPVFVNMCAIAMISRAPKVFRQRVVFATPIDEILRAFVNAVPSDYLDELKALADGLCSLELDECDRALNRYLGSLGRLGQGFHELAIRALGFSTRRIEEACLEATYVPTRLQQVREAHELWVDGNDSVCPIPASLPDAPASIADAFRAAAAVSPRLQILITGYAGSGKTTLLNYIAGRALSAPSEIGLATPMLPLLVSLPELARVGSTTCLTDWLLKARTLGAVVCDLPGGDWGLVEEFTSKVDAPLLLLLDGLDEVPEHLRRDLWRSFRMAIVNHGYNWVIASRPPTSHEDPVNDISQRALVSTYKILPWTDEELRTFAVSVLGAKADAFLKQFRLMAMGRTTMTPLLALIGMCVYDEGPARLPRTRAELLEIFVDNAILRGSEKHDSEPLEKEDRLELIEQLAGVAALTTESPERCDIDDVLNVLAGKTTTHSRGSAVSKSRSKRARAVFERAGLHSGLLATDGNGRVIWWHSCLREYLAARALADSSDADRLQKLQLCHEPQWVEVVVLMLVILSVRHYRNPSRNEDVTKYFDALGEQENGGLVMYFALADGAAVSGFTEWRVISNLVDGAIRMGQLEECESFNEELAIQGRSPVQLLLKLRRTARAVEGIVRIKEHPDVLPWMREEARLALEQLESGGRGDLERGEIGA